MTPLSSNKCSRVNLATVVNTPGDALRSGSTTPGNGGELQGHGWYDP